MGRGRGRRRGAWGLERLYCNKAQQNRIRRWDFWGFFVVLRRKNVFFLCVSVFFSYLCSDEWHGTWSVLTGKTFSEPACRCPVSASGGKGTGERKVRATQGIPLPNGKRSARVCRCRRKQPPVWNVETSEVETLKWVRVRRWGKSLPGRQRCRCCALRELKVHVNRQSLARPQVGRERRRPVWAGG